MSGQTPEMQTIADRFGRVLIGVGILILAYLAVAMLPKMLPSQTAVMAVRVVALLMVVFVVFNAWQLSTAIGWTGFDSLLTIIPLIGLFYLFALTNKAGKILKQNGYKVGVLSASPQ